MKSFDKIYDQLVYEKFMENYKIRCLSEEKLSSDWYKWKYNVDDFNDEDGYIPISRPADTNPASKKPDPPPPPPPPSPSAQLDKGEVSEEALLAAEELGRVL